MKKCSKCKIEKELSDFYKGSKRCKSCYIEYQNSWNKLHPERNKNYSKNNPEGIKQSRKKWRDKNKSDISNYNKKYSKDNPERIKEKQNRFLEKKRIIKKQCVDYLGGKCLKCGYDKNMHALECHHIDPTLKEYSICSKPNKSFEYLKKELDKCILLCSNCHRELHNPINT